MKYTARLLLIITAIFFAAGNTVSQEIIKKQVEAYRTPAPPEIDGLLDEPQWNNAGVATDFYQYDPYNGPPATEKTKVRIMYDDVAVYIGAMMYDNAPDSILTELGFRDSDELNADYILFELSPYNDGLNSSLFGVTASGVQFDAKNYNDDDDEGWDAVWQSKVTLLDSGWIAELKIPYSALRFPDKPEQTWGFNAERSIRRKREIDTWNFINKKIEGKTKQAGELTGFRDIEPPLRLSFTPYVSGYLEKNAGKSDWDYSFNYGMDLKYGINESFTLDMTLIPDFGQVQSDDQIYNLSPFEVYYEEQRPFFTEGIELFEKGDIFYSRRVGDVPEGFDAVQDSLQQGEFITENPARTNLINATKVSGRTSGGLGIGVFNALSGKTYATISDSLGNTRKILTQPLTNYNMIVIDQNLKHNSYLSLYNSNVYKGKDHYVANVSGTEFQLFNKSTTYSIYGRFNLSQKYFPDSANDLGFMYTAALMKTSGQFRFSLSQHMESDRYDPNDLGYLQANNEVNYNLEFDYNFYDPFWKFLWMRNSLEFWYQSLYLPRKFTEFGIFARSRATFRNYLTTGFHLWVRPVDEHDYYESRVNGRVFLRPPEISFGAFLSPDYRKSFIVDLNGDIERSAEYDQTSWSLEISPRWRVNDRLTFRIRSEYEKDINDLGYVDHLGSGDETDIVFGRRDLQTVENIIQTSYIFTSKLALDFRLRHYWLKAIYDKYYLLDKDGYLDPSAYSENNNFNYNAFNIDAVVRWEFAPGSELALAWKNAILTYNESDITRTFFNNLKNTLESPADNSLSIKLLYYLDYLYLKRRN